MVLSHFKSTLGDTMLAEETTMVATKIIIFPFMVSPGQQDEVTNQLSWSDFDGLRISFEFWFFIPVPACYIGV